MNANNKSNSCRIYLASDFSLNERLCTVHEALTEAGYEVPDVWWSYDLKGLELPDNKWYQFQKVSRTANWHWEVIEQSDVCVLVAPENTAHTFTKGNLQLGYAHGNGLDLYAVGEIEQCVLYEPINRCGTIEDLLTELDEEYS
jgi:hypothetical protein